MCAKIKRDAQNVRAFTVGKIDLRDAAERTCGLIHQSARLAEIVALRALTDACECERVHTSAVIKCGEDRAGENFKRRRGREPTSGGHKRMDAGAKASDAKPFRSKPCRNAADERGGRAGLGFPRHEIVERYVHASKPLGDDLHSVVRCGRGGRGNVPRDRGAKHDAELVIGVVSGKLRAPRGTQQKRVRYVAERLEVFLAKPRIACSGGVRRAVERCELRVARSGGEPLFPRRNIHWIDSSGHTFVYARL